MCGRYSLALRPGQVRAYLQNEQMQVDEAPDDDAPDAPRQSYNFAPGYHGIVYRADTPDHGAGPRQHKKRDGEDEPEDEPEDVAAGAPETEIEAGKTRYKLQSMEWGLIPFWTKRNPDYGSMLKTINCRADSLIENRGMWTTMKQKKRCIVVAQGFYEWLKKGKEKIPHYTKRKDGQLMCFAGLWDCVQYQGSEDKHYTYTIITTESNKQLKFLHDRMPVILENGSENVRTWLDPKRYTWSKELQSLLKPFDGELECYPVSKDVGKVGNNSPTFIIPVASSENKSNIANFFAKGASKGNAKPPTTTKLTNVKKEDDEVDREAIKHTGTEEKSPIPTEEMKIKKETKDDRKTVDHTGTEDNAPLPIETLETKRGIKRHLDDVLDEDLPKKISKVSPDSTTKIVSPQKSARKMRSATSNNTTSPSKRAGKEKGTQKITNFFEK